MENINQEIRVEKETIIKEVPVERIVEKTVEVEKEVIKEIQSNVSFEGKPNIIKGLVNFNKKLQNISKTANNPFTKSTYLDLATMLEEIRPMLAEEGLCISQNVINHPTDERRFAVDTFIIHEEGEVLRIPGVFHKPDALTVQGMGAFETYNRRYSLMAIFNIVGKNDDTDGEIPGQEQSNKQTRESAPQPPENTDTPSTGRRLRR